MSSGAWVVECPTCHCVIVAFARDPQLEHGKGETLLPPQSSCVLECICCGSAYRYSGADFVQEMPKRNHASRRICESCEWKNGSPDHTNRSMSRSLKRAA